jgi:hypothetical protein
MWNISFVEVVDMYKKTVLIFGGTQVKIHDDRNSNKMTFREKVNGKWRENGRKSYIRDNSLIILLLKGNDSFTEGRSPLPAPPPAF